MALHSAPLSAQLRPSAKFSADTLGRRFRRVLAVAVAVAAILAGLSAPTHAQTIVPLGNNITTVAGGYTGSYTKIGTTTSYGVCGNLASGPYTAADTLGNGCPGLYAKFGADTRGGITADGQGNIYIADSTNSQIRKYDPRTGIVSRFAGGGTVCGAALDANGNGCPASQSTFASPRGIGIDPYGNVLTGGYSDNQVRVICNTASPLCPNTANRKQVGNVYRVAGCIATVASSGAGTTATTAGTGGDGGPASPYGNLSGDAGSTGYGTCSASTGGVAGPRGASADKWGNVYIGDTTNGRYRIVLGPQTSTYFTGNNPMWALVQQNPTYSAATLHEGYIYPLLYGFSAQTVGSVTYNVFSGSAAGSCFTGGPTSIDKFGDGCPYFSNAASADTGHAQGIEADTYGNIFVSDAISSELRVIYAGGANAAANPVYAAIIANNTGVTPTTGYVYLLAGVGATALSATPALGSSIAVGNGIYKLWIGPGGNLYVGDTAKNAVAFYDINTGYYRGLSINGTACAAHATGSANGDLCPSGTQVLSGANAFGVATDPLANVYAMDQSTATLRKLEAVSLPSITVGSTLANSATYVQTLRFHGPAGTASMTATTLNSAPDITVGTPACAAAAGDGTVDCSVNVTFAPNRPGTRTLNLAVSLLNASSTVLASGTYPVSGLATGSALVADLSAPAVANVAATGTTPVSAATDNSGNVYYVDSTTNSVQKYNVQAGTTTTVGTAPAGAIQVAVDQLGNVYVTSTSSASVTKFALTGANTYAVAATVTYPGATLPQGIAFDSVGNVFVADKTTGTVLQFAAGNAIVSGQGVTTVATGLSNPVGLALDGLGDVLIADKTNGVYRVTNVNGVTTQALYAATTGGTVTIASLQAVAVAGDAAGNVYVQDNTSKKIFSIPVSQAGPTTTTVLSGLSAPSGLAVDGNGVIYSADSAGSLKQVQRNSATYAFGSDTSTVVAATITNAGNLSATGYQAVGLDSAEFPITSLSPTNCYANTAITPGYACSVTTQFTPGSGTGNVSSTLAYTVAANTVGFLKFTGVKTGAAVTTITTITGQTPANPVYSASGTEVTFTVNVAASDSSTATGYVNVTVDALAPVAYTLVNGSVTVPLSGLNAGSHTITAAYPTQSGLTGSTSSTTSFTIAQATTTTSWTPGATTQQYSAAVGPAVLNATAVITSTSTSVPGFFLYTATPSGGTAATIHSASFLPIGTYSLGVTFVPTDSTNYVGSTATVPTYTVTKANTSASLGATTNLVAADGTGNFTSIQAAVNTIPATGGGAIYIKPGTYSENVAVVQPNVALRGLGGDPNGVILTHVAGSFGGTGTYAYAGEFTTALTNGYQLPAGSTRFNGDEGSATIVVARGINTAVSTATLTPNNFFADNITFRNTYNTDTTLTTTYVNSGSCTANAGPAMAYNVLFAAGTQCASQALAIWITSDLAVANNVNFTSGQDTIYNGSQGGSPYVPARQYYFRGKVTGVVDYIFGDSASVFDYSSIYTANRTTATVEAQNKAVRTGAAGDYLSADIMNSNVFTSYINPQGNLYFGRPYGVYSTYIMLNSYVDQVNPLGYEEFSGNTNLPTSTYGEYNTMVYTDPAFNQPDLNGVPYIGSGGNTGQGVTGTRENTSQNPGTPQAANSIKTLLTAAQATQYYPTNFLSTTVTNSSTGVTNWNPTTAIANNVNAFATAGTATSIAGGSSITILMRPQTPGIGAITNGTYTIPTGTYTLSDTFNSATTTLASGNLDAAGEAYLVTSTLAPGTHSLSWTYSGDSNFNASTTASAYTIIVAPYTTTTTLGIANNPITYGQSDQVTVTVSSASGTPTGNATLYVDGASAGTQALSTGATTFTVNGLAAGSHSVYATFAANSTYGASTSSTMTLTVNQAVLTVTGVGANRRFNQANALSFTVSGYQYTDNASTVFSAGPTVTTAATRDSVAGTYTVTPAATLTAFGNTNYTLALAPGTFTVTGGDPQVILFAPLPNFPSGGTYQLTARTTSGLPVTYTVTSGNATVNGTAIMVTGAGAVTVQASTAADATGDYATATPVSRSFTAQ